MSAPEGLTAAAFVARLRPLATPEQHARYERAFPGAADGSRGGDVFLGVRMGDVFALAKAFLDLPLTEVEVLLDDEVHEVRAGACSIMDKQARRKRTPPEQRAALFDLALRRHDRIDDWDLVDLVAPHVVGGWVYDGDGDPAVLDRLVRSEVL